MQRLLAIFGLCLWGLLTLAQEEGPALKKVVIDTFQEEAPQCVRVDTRGRIFAGSRESLFVHEPNAQGGYQPRRRLLRFPAETRINDIEILGDDLYVLTAGGLYQLPGAVRKRENLPIIKLIWGVPVDSAPSGDGALAWGPQGDLYFTMSAVSSEPEDARRPDRWEHWMLRCQPLGTRLDYHGNGGVFRCKPDGSDLQVVARGISRPRGLVFDREGNLFCIDQPVSGPGRLWHVVPRAYYAWPRGRMEKIPALAHGLPPMFVGTPQVAMAGLAYYDETSWPLRFRHALLMALGPHIMRYPIESHGASFTTHEFLLTQGTHRQRAGRMVIGCDGDLLALMSNQIPTENAAKETCELVQIIRAEDPAPTRFEPYEAVEATTEKLRQELGHPCWQRRSRAHLELNRRGGELFKEANQLLLKMRASDPALSALIWLAARSGQGSLHLLALVDHADPRVRVQVARALSEYPEQIREEPIFTKLLLDSDPHVQHVALLAHFDPRVAWNRTVEKIVERGPACGTDPYLRQAATLLLAEKATRQHLEDLCQHSESPLRLAGVLAAGWRLTLPPAQKVLASHLPLSPLRNQSAYVVDYPDGKLDLRKLGRTGTYTIAEHWKVDMHTEDQERLFKMLRHVLNDPDAAIRTQAAYFLWILNDSRSHTEVQRVLDLGSKKTPR